MSYHYHTVKLRVAGDHIKSEHLLPADCKQITGMAYSALSLSELESNTVPVSLTFPSTKLQENLSNIDLENKYDALLSQSSESTARSYFKSNFVDLLKGALLSGIVFTTVDQQVIADRLSELLNGTPFVDYIFEYDTFERYIEKRPFSSTSYREYQRIRLEITIKERVISYLQRNSARIFYYDKVIQSFPESPMRQVIFPLVFPQSILLENLRAMDLPIDYLANTQTEISAQQYFQQKFIPCLEEKLFERINYQAIANSELQTRLQSMLKDPTFIAAIFDNDYYTNYLRDKKYPVSLEEMFNRIIFYLSKRKKDIFFYERQYIDYPTQSGEQTLITTLINGNSFLLRDFPLPLNRRLKPIRKEIKPFSEPIMVNSSATILIKNKSGLPLDCYVYFQYQTEGA
ncbi:hypothetical protein [Persicobacter psychrovividus]|uniref:Uncharacterized protein n=1 Tax=Persicobacter psychrovividus TaxID=387638 RepID=A0ABM7VN95_9BACT|nr:hypothetical protein PEPS_47490 [Persicobacter psychrovividus]